MSKVSPKCSIDIAEHSMCQPGRPGPISVSHCGSSGEAGAFQSAKSRASSRSEEHTSELQSPCNLVCRLLLEKKKKQTQIKAASRQPILPVQRVGCVVR